LSASTLGFTAGFAVAAAAVVSAFVILRAPAAGFCDGPAVALTTSRDARPSAVDIPLLISFVII
jgi:hypothetical protein